MPANEAGQTRDQSIPSHHAQLSTGRIAFDGTSITAADFVPVAVGYSPRYVCWENATDRVKVEWYEGMDPDTAIKTAATGTRTLSTSAGITVTDGEFRVSQNATLGAVAASKVCYWRTLA